LVLEVWKGVYHQLPQDQGFKYGKVRGTLEWTWIDILAGVTTGGNGMPGLVRRPRRLRGMVTWSRVWPLVPTGTGLSVSAMTLLSRFGMRQSARDRKREGSRISRGRRNQQEGIGLA